MNHWEMTESQKDAYIDYLHDKIAQQRHQLWAFLIIIILLAGSLIYISTRPPVEPDPQIKEFISSDVL